jgi:hypothetical protein
MKHYLPKINVVTLCLAILVFFVPWTVVRCNGNDFATQTGIQTIYGGFSLKGDFEALNKPDANESKDEPGMAPIVAVSFLATIAALGLAIAAMVGRTNLASASTALATIALVLILLQAVLGFPMNNAIVEANRKTPEQDRALNAMVRVSADRTPWYYLELALLAIPLIGSLMGSRLPTAGSQSPRCAKCGATLRADENFCSKCGTPRQPSPTTP